MSLKLFNHLRHTHNLFIYYINGLEVMPIFYIRHLQCGIHSLAIYGLSYTHICASMFY